MGDRYEEVGGVKPPRSRAESDWLDCRPRRSCRLAVARDADDDGLFCTMRGDPFTLNGNVGDMLLAVSLKSFSNIASCRSSARGGYRSKKHAIY